MGGGKRFAGDFQRIDAVKPSDKLLIQDSEDGNVKFAFPGQFTAINGYKTVESVDDLPLNPVRKNIAYVVGDNMYFWVGTGGDTLNGVYQRANIFKGERGESGALRLIEQTTSDTTVELQHNAMHVWSEPVSELNLTFGASPAGYVPTYAVQFIAPSKGLTLNVDNVKWEGGDNMPAFAGKIYTIWFINGIAYVTSIPDPIVTLRATYQGGTDVKIIKDTTGIIAMRINGVSIEPTATLTINEDYATVEIDLEATYDGVNSMFSSCFALTSLEFVRGRFIRLVSTRYMFNSCQALTSLDLSGLDTSSVTDMGYMFNNCQALTNLDVSGLNTSSVTDMSHMFSSCYSLTSLDLSGWNTSSVTYMNYMFSLCEALTSIDVSGWNTSSVTDMEHIFSGCIALTSLDVSGFDTSSVTDMKYMFKGCQFLTSLDVSGWNTSKVKTMEHMFSGCFTLSSLDVSGFDTSSVTDMKYMFASCEALTSIAFTGNLASVNGIGYMFSYCQALTSLSFAGVTAFNATLNVPSSMFSGTTSTGEFVYNGSVDFSKIIDVLPPTWTSRAV